MEDVFDEMDQEEIKEWKVQYLVRRYQETPAWLSMCQETPASLSMYD